jgi:uncharacterized protein (DUF2249 family)
LRPRGGCSDGTTHETQEVIAVEANNSTEVTAGGPEELDVRALPHGTRHEIIFAKLDRLGPGDSLIIVNDHDPKPLRYQTGAMWPDRFDWSYLESGPQQWRVAITRAG